MTHIRFGQPEAIEPSLYRLEVVVPHIDKGPQPEDWVFHLQELLVKSPHWTLFDPEGHELVMYLRQPIPEPHDLVVLHYDRPEIDIFNKAVHPRWFDLAANAQTIRIIHADGEVEWMKDRWGYDVNETGRAA